MKFTTMGSKTFSGFFLVVILLELISLSEAYKFFVGGKDGWVLNPSENFDHWAQRNRFQVNDTLFFKYKQGLESVLVVSKDDYYSCNTNNPITSLTNGDSVFQLDRSGPFYFIAGSFDKCQKGQKLHLVVLAVRAPKGQHNTTSPSPSPSSDAAQSPRADPPAPQQRVDPSSLEDAPSPSPAGHRSAAAAIGFGGTVFGIFIVVAHVVLVTFVGNIV